MMKTFTITALMLASLTIAGKAQVTITAADMPVPTAPYNMMDISATAAASPTIGTNQSWNYGSFSSVNAFTNDYPSQNDPYFTAAGINVSAPAFKLLNTALGYDYIGQYDFNANGVVEAGIDIPYQPYSLAAVTMATTDSLIIPAQKALFTTPKTVMQFPMTANSSWHSVSPRVTDFTLTVAAYMLNHVPCQHRYQMFRNDTIIGWGKLVVNTANGPSIAYDVLLDRCEQYATDSFYLNGSPAPTQLLTAFAISQGQVNDENYAYNFYRKGSFSYLMRIAYGTDNTFTTKEGVYVNRDNLLAGVEDLSGASYSAVIFPNPANTNEINVQVVGKNIASISYRITDITGKTVQTGNATVQGGGAKMPLNAGLVNGNYFITLMDDATHEMIAEKINLQR